MELIKPNLIPSRIKKLFRYFLLITLIFHFPLIVGRRRIYTWVISSSLWAIKCSFMFAKEWITIWNFWLSWHDFHFISWNCEPPTLRKSYLIVARNDEDIMKIVTIEDKVDMKIDQEIVGKISKNISWVNSSIYNSAVRTWKTLSSAILHEHKNKILIDKLFSSLLYNHPVTWHRCHNTKKYVIFSSFQYIKFFNSIFKITTCNTQRNHHSRSATLEENRVWTWSKRIVD